MLKIKKNVNLKELEKFGFEKDGFQYIINRCEDKVNSLDGFSVELDSRLINNYSTENDTLDILYDLIQAGLVDKVNG